MKMKRIKLTVSYDGTNYCGWQIQPNGVTIEEVLNQALFKLTGEKIKVIGASRTDAGVHALGNVAVFDTFTTIPVERIKPALNQKLPEDIVVTRSKEVSLDWHPRYQDSVKTYEYYILTGEVPDPTKRLTHCFTSHYLDVDKMKEAMSYFVGEHDFAEFTRAECLRKNTVRTIYKADTRQEGNVIVFEIQGNGFLYNMIRMMVGLVMHVGRGSCLAKTVIERLEEGKIKGTEKKKGLKLTAPAKGLILKNIEYKE
jgi:tRNA pseudouridine38-40 synthase